MTDDEVRIALVAARIQTCDVLNAYRLGVEQERKLTKISQVGNTIFHPGVSVQMLVERAEREYEYEQTPERKALRKERLEHFRVAIERGE